MTNYAESITSRRSQILGKTCPLGIVQWAAMVSMVCDAALNKRS